MSRRPLHPQTALTLALSGVGFTLTLDELRAAWHLANDQDKPLIAAQARALKENAA